MSVAFMFCCCIPDLLVVLLSLCLTVCWSPLGEPSIKSPLNSWYVHQDQWYLVPIISKIMTTPRTSTMNMIIPELTIIKKERHSQHRTRRTECQHCPDLFDGEKHDPTHLKLLELNIYRSPPISWGKNPMGSTVVFTVQIFRWQIHWKPLFPH